MSISAPRTTARSRTSSAPATPTTPIRCQIRPARLSRRRAARRRARRRAASPPAPSRGRSCRACACAARSCRSARTRSTARNWDWDEIGNNPFFCPDAKHGAGLGRLISTACARQGSRSAPSSRSSPKACRPGSGAPIYAKLDQDIASALMSINAVKGVEIGDGLRRGSAHRRGKCRRNAHGQGRHARVPVEQCRRHSRRHLDRPADRRALRGQADLVDPDAARRRSIRPAATPRSRPKAATILASAFARCRSARR